MSVFLRKLLVPAAVIGLTAALWSFQGNKAKQQAPQAAATLSSTYTPVLTQANSSGMNHQFSVGASLPAATTNPDVSPLQSWQVFFCLGDGRFWMGSLADFEARNFHYRQPGMYNPYVETTEAYDDDDDPSLRTQNTVNVSPTATDPSDQSLRVTMGTGQSVLLQSSRNPKPEDYITYIITYEHNKAECRENMRGDLKFHYDDSVMTYDGMDTGHYPSGQQVLNTSGTGSGVVQIDFNTLAYQEQRNVFLHFIVKDVKITAPFVPSWVDMTGIIPDPTHATTNCTTFTANSAMSAQTLVPSHDPNKKVASPSEITILDEWIEYTVHFQNDGPGPATWVTIEDELDLFLSNAAPVFVDAYPPGKLTNTTPVHAGRPRTWRWTFNGLNLRSIHEPGYGISFTEADTKGFLKFKVHVDTIVDCGAILNRARIVFDCNPPMWTDYAVTAINCASQGTMTACVDSGIQWLPPLDSLTPGTPVGSLLAGYGLNLSAYQHFKWYPSVGLTDPWSPNTGLDMARPGEYALVASKACGRRIFILPVGTTAGPPTSPIIVEDVPGDCQADLLVSGGEPPYTFKWQYNGGPPQSGSSTLSLVGKSNVSVTVTDSSPNSIIPSGPCAVVFTPIPGKCGQTPWPWCWVWAALGISALLVVIYRFRKK